MADPDAAQRDAELMQAFQRGDEAAFETLVDRHRERVFRLACRYLGDETAADDLAQEAFLRVYRARHTWRPEAKFSTWLYRVTANACLNELRSRRVRRAVETTASVPPGGDAGAGGPALDGPDPRATDPGDAALRGELAGVVRAAVQELPEDQRMAVLLSKYEGLSYRELADAMDRSLPAVKSLLVRARENLRKSLAPYLDRAPVAKDGDVDGDDAVSPAERLKRDRRARRDSEAGAAAADAATDSENRP
jgi:RNA polymerase sigma-70 factor (ECF subfamily)